MPFEAQLRVFFVHAATVVADVNERQSAVEKLNVNMLCTRIETVFQQLLHDVGGTFDDFAGGNLIGDNFRQNADERHALITSDFNPKRKVYLRAKYPKI